MTENLLAMFQYELCFNGSHCWDTPNPGAIGSRFVSWELPYALLCSTLRSAHSRGQEVCIILGNSCAVVPQLETNKVKFMQMFADVCPYA